METREETEDREKKLVDDTKRFAQSNLRKLGINITNPLAGLDVLGKPEYDKVNRKENWAGPEIENISKDVLSQIAIKKIPQKSLVPKLPPRSDGGRMINITPKRANEIVTSIIDGRIPKGDLTDFTTGSLKPNSMFSPNYRPPNVMYSVGVEPVKDWKKYGYGPDEIPTQVQKAETLEDRIKVADSLDGFYNRTQQYVNSRLGTKGSIKDVKKVLSTNPAYWTNPVTNKIYRASWKGGLSRRLTIKPVNRDFLQYQQSSVIQKAGNLLNQKQIAKMNANLKTQYEQKYKQLATRNEQLNTEIAYLKENPGAAYASDRQLNTKLAEQQRVNTQIENLVKGEYYTEHGYYLQSAKVRNHIVDNNGDTIHNSKEFQLGDLKNQTTVFENQNLTQHESFRKIKNRFEIAIDSLNDGYYQYPGLVVNYSPTLSGGREFVIRIEKSEIGYTDDGIPILKDFKVGREITGVLSGPKILEINYATETELLDSLKTTEDIKNWLATKGIHPVPKDQSFKQQPFKVRQNRKPTKSKSETIAFYKDLINKAYDLRMSIEEYFKSIGTTPGDAPVKKGRPKGATDLKHRKTKNKDQGKLF